MNKERLSRLIAQYQKNMEFYRNAREFNEQDCRDEFISPLLERSQIPHRFRILPEYSAPDW